MSPLAAQAEPGEGTHSGGGGGSIVCFDSPDTLKAILARGGKLTPDERDNHVVSVLNYDLYQASLPRGWDHTPSPVFEIEPGERIDSYLERLAQRFDSTVPRLSDLIRRASVNLQRAKVFNNEGSVTQLHDAEEVVGWDPETCTLITTAYQYTEGATLYIALDRKLFDYSTEQSQATLQLHEGLYSIARTLGQTDSRKTRDLISEILPAEIRKTPEELVQALMDFGLPCTPEAPCDFAARQLIQHKEAARKAVSDAGATLAQRAAQVAAQYDAAHGNVRRKMIKEIGWCDSRWNLFSDDDCDTPEKLIHKKFARYFEERLAYVRRTLLPERDTLARSLLEQPYAQHPELQRDIPRLLDDRFDQVTAAAQGTIESVYGGKK
jgi:hypothetical protein